MVRHMRRAGFAAVVVVVALASATPASAFVSPNAASEDGSRVIFESDEQLAPTDTDNFADVYERSAGTTTQLSRGNINGNAPTNTSFATASSDARHVFFHTDEQLLNADGNAVTDAYERFNGATSLVTQGSIPGAVGGTVSGVSPDGSSAFFQTFAQLAPEDQDDDLDLYERADQTNTNLVTACDAVCGNTTGVSPAFNGASTDGSRAFFLTSEQMVVADQDAQVDVYERSGGTTKLVTQGEPACQPACGNANVDTFLDAASLDGTRAFFASGEQLVSGDTDAQLDVYERSGGTTSLVTPGTSESVEGVDLSRDVSTLLVQTQEQLVGADTDSAADIYGFSGGPVALVSQGEPGCQPGCGNGSFDPSIEGVSNDGSVALFSTDEQLVSGDTDTERDIYKRSGAVTTRVSVGQINGNGPFGPNYGGVSSDGSRVFFRTEERLAGTDTDDADDVYERSGGTTIHLSRGQINGNGDNSADFRLASGDGSRVVFTTTERLTTADLDNENDIYERSAGITKLVSAEGVPPQTSIASGPAGTTADPTPRFTFSSNEAGSTFACSVDGGGFSPCGSPRTIGPLDNGPHSFRVRATDPAGNADATPDSRSFAVNAPPPGDDDPPETTITSGPKAKAKSRNASFEFSSDEAESRFECSVDGEHLGPCSSPFTRRVKRTRHTFEVVATDDAGNTDPTPAEHGWKVKKKRKR